VNKLTTTALSLLLVSLVGGFLVSPILKKKNRLAGQGDADAQVNLGLMYANGEGVSQKNVRAYVWWSVAAEQGREDAKNDRDMVFERLTPDQRARGQEIAAKYFESDYQDCEGY
jgi:TPR repeat protein